MRITSLTFFWFLFCSAFLYSIEESSIKREIYSHFLNASLLEKQGKFERALKEYNQTLEMEPTATWVLNQRATLHLKMGNPEKALQDASKYSELHNKDPQPHYLIATIYLSLNQKLMAKQQLLYALDLDPNHEECLLLLGQLLVDQEPSEAIAVLTKLVKIHPGSQEGYYALGYGYQKLGKINEAKITFKKVIELDPNSYQSLMLLGQMNENEQKIEDAIYYFEKALLKMPENFSLSMQLTKLYHEKKEYEKIIALLTKFEESSPQNSELLSWVGLAYEQMRQNKKALEYYEKATLYTQSPEIFLHLASLYDKEKDQKNLIRTLKTLNKKFPQDLQFTYLLGLAYLDQKESHKAISSFEKIVEHDKNNVPALFQLGVSYDAIKKWETAEKYFKKILEIDPRNGPSYNYLAYSYVEKSKNLEDARKWIDRALTMEPENPAFLDTLGWLEYKEKNYSKALSYLEKSSKNLQDSAVLDHLGDCYLALQEYSKAALSYERALELNPRDKEIEKKLNQLNQRLVPTSPARKLLKIAERRWQKTFYLSGNVRVKIKGSKLGPTIPQNGTFYLKKLAPLTTTLKIPTYLRMDFLDPKTLFIYTLRYQNTPNTEWNSFPPEIKDSLPEDSLKFLDWISSLFNGRFLADLDRWETEVQTKKNYVLLTYKDMRVKISKEGVLKEVQIGTDKLKIKKFETVGSTELPSQIEMSGNYLMDIELFKFSEETLEESLFK